MLAALALTALPVFGRCLVYMQALVDCPTCFYGFEEPEETGCLPDARERNAEGLHLKEEFLPQMHHMTSGKVVMDLMCGVAQAAW